ncbi:MAG: DUF4416 family protein [Candidatus Binatia bacterium]
MGTPAEPKPVNYFVGLLSPDAEVLTTVEKDLAEILGPVDDRSEILPWSLSGYYEKEMGSRLLKRFISFGQLSSPGRLAGVKLQTQEIEVKYRMKSAGRIGRRVNVDPGYIDAGKVVMASTKSAGHRIYLNFGIYAEPTLLYYNGAFQSCRYTYPDFLWPQTLSFLGSVRRFYLNKLRSDRESVAKG